MEATRMPAVDPSDMVQARERLKRGCRPTRSKCRVEPEAWPVGNREGRREYRTRLVFVLPPSRSMQVDLLNLRAP